MILYWAERYPNSRKLRVRHWNVPSYFHGVVKQWIMQLDCDQTDWLWNRDRLRSWPKPHRDRVPTPWRDWFQLSGNTTLFQRVNKHNEHFEKPVNPKPARRIPTVREWAEREMRRRHTFGKESSNVRAGGDGRGSMRRVYKMPRFKRKGIGLI